MSRRLVARFFTGACVALLVSFSPFWSLAAQPASKAAATPGKSSSARSQVDFARDIRPLLSDACYTCHGPDSKARATDLRLDTRAGAFADLGGYKAIVPGDLKESQLYQRITSSDADEQMPPPDSTRRLSKREIDLLRRWIEQGAQWRNHWSFERPEPQPLPQVNRGDWCRNPIDRFVLARIEAAGLEPSPQASRETLIRRLTLDLTGLPPTLQEIDNFLADVSPAAYERLVDRLLASPRYGEHMAAAWLDAARYSDTNGYQQDRTRTMWPWRDWVVRSLNAGMPFDQFTREQVAGDLLPGATRQQQLASGFHRNHMLNGEGGRIAEESRVEYVVDRVETTGAVWLGLTTGCARCHDHKYDPLSQQEFYQLYSYFNHIEETGRVDRGGNANPVMRIPTPEQQRRIDELEAQLARLATKAKLTDQEKKHRDSLKKQLGALKKSVVEVMVMRDRKQPRPTFVLRRGQYDKPDKKQPVEPAVPSVLHDLPPGAPPNRLALADWLVAPENPLTARVVVNRQWRRFFGQGLVTTAEDFGAQGEPPSHPRLLDWLALRLQETGWDVKRLHRLIVTSAAYRQSSKVTPELLERDPQNRLLARAARFRLSSLALRDQALAASGLLVGEIGGPPVKPYQPAGVWADFSLGKIKYQRDRGAALYRRSLYIFWRRSVGPTMLFDSPSRQVCTVRVSRTNSPLHALTTFNETGYVEAARNLAARLLAPRDMADKERLARGFRLATARRPEPRELEVLTAGLERALGHYKKHPEDAKKLLATGESPPPAGIDPARLAAYTAVAATILNLDEVLTRE